MKNIIIGLISVAVIVVGYAVFRPQLAVAPTPTPSPTATASPTKVPGTSKTPTPTPTPGIIIRETKIHQATIQNFKFSPSPLTVVQGDIVIFTNMDGIVHTVTALTKQFDSKNLRQGDQWTLATANLAPGTYEYQCTPHPSMRGTLIVQLP